MTNISALSSGMQAFQTAYSQVEQSAQDIARQTGVTADVSAPSLEEALV